jgi:hypothetical protein
MGFAGQAQQTSASKVAHYGTKKRSGSGSKKKRRSKTAGARTKSRKAKTKRKAGPKPGTKAWMTKIRGMRGKKKKKK